MVMPIIDGSVFVSGGCATAPRRSTRWLIWNAPILASLAMGSVLAGQVDVGVALARLAAEHGFRIDGREHLQGRLGWLGEGDPSSRLRILLEGFDHILIHGTDGRIERVLVLGVQSQHGSLAPLVGRDLGAQIPAESIELPTQRRGNQHLVGIDLEGAGSRRLPQDLLIDTGADALVLPVSMIARLGIGTADLVAREVQTANGRTHARYGRLPAVWLNGQRVADVAVAFLDDSQLGEHGLLGMSVLGRFRMTIDDQAHVLVLAPR